MVFKPSTHQSVMLSSPSMLYKRGGNMPKYYDCPISVLTAVLEYQTSCCENISEGEVVLYLRSAY